LRDFVTRLYVGRKPRQLAEEANPGAARVVHAVSVRSFRAEKLSEFVGALIAGEMPAVTA
jgi:hypothetical protein